MKSSQHSKSRCKTKKRRRSIIHITIRPAKINPSRNISIHSTVQHDQILSQSQYSNKPSNIIVDTTRETFANSNDYMIKHCQLQTKKKKFQYFRYLLLTILILLGITIILIIILLTRSPAKTLQRKSPILRWNSNGLTIAGTTGQSGYANNQLKYPYGLTLDWTYALYIAERYNHRIQKYSRNALYGETIAGQALGTDGSGANFFNGSADVEIDSNGDIYIADAFNNRIQLWRHEASTGLTVAGTPGNSSTTLYEPYGVTLNSNFNGFYISDYGNHRVMYYSSGSGVGTIVAGGNNSGVNKNQLKFPVDLYVDTLSNSLIIANFGANNIVRWQLGASNWTLVAGNENGTDGSTSLDLSMPWDLTVDPIGNTYVADTGNQRIQLFLYDKKNGTTIAGKTGINGNNASLFNIPSSIALDNQLNLYVSDYGNHRVQKFVRY